MRIGLLQTHAEPCRAANLKRLAPLMDEAGRIGVQVLVLPELFSLPFVSSTPDPAYFDGAEPLDGPSGKFAQEASGRHEMVVVSSIFEQSALRGVYHNTAAVYDRGEQVGVYRKSHLPFSLAFPEKFYFRPGDQPPLTVDTSATRIGVIICYERHYPEMARSAALAGAQLLCIPIAASTPSMREVFDIELRAHAIANGLYVVAPNRIGREGEKDYFGGSVIYGPDGSQVARAVDTGDDELITTDIDLNEIARIRRDRPFLRDRRPELYTA